METKRNPIKVLMADDEIEFLEATTSALQRRGFLVIQAEDGRQALDRVQQEEPDVIVLDVKMPGIDGVEVFHRLKSLLPEVPVVMLTGHGNIQQAFETSREGVFEYLTKPCDINNLAIVLKRAVEDRELKSSRKPLKHVIRLLFVDDEIDFVSSLTPALERRGIHVTSAITGEEAVKIASTRFFDVALIDCRMPGMNGLTLLKRLKDYDKNLEIIVLTGHPSTDDAVCGIRDGAFDYLTKPQTIEVLVSRIRSAANRREQNVDESNKKAVDQILSRQPD